MQTQRCVNFEGPSISPPETSPAAAGAAGDRNKAGSAVPPATSDYFSESLNNQRSQCTSVDITSTASPLLDFGKKERDYISKVIQITCQRTTLLRKSKFPNTSYLAASSSYNSPLLKKSPLNGKMTCNFKKL